MKSTKFTAEEWFDKAVKAYKNGEYNETCSYLKKATELKPDYALAFNNWGVALSDMLDQTGKEEYFRECIDKYRRATTIDPDYAVAYYNWANALSDMAEVYDNAQLYAESVEKYRQAAKLRPDDADIYYSWGNALLALADLRKDEKLYELCFDKYAKAAELNNEAEIFNNWGIALSNFARMKKDANIYKECFDKYAKAISIRPNYIKARFNWGLDLLDLAKMEGNIHNHKAEIEEKFMKTFELNSRKAAYNLTSLYSLTGDKEKAFEWLQKTLDSTNIPREFIEAEPDFANIKNDERFSILLNQYRVGHKNDAEK